MGYGDIEQHAYEREVLLEGVRRTPPCQSDQGDTLHASKLR